MSPPTSQTMVRISKGSSLRSNGTRAATHIASSTNISASCGDGSMKAIELNDIVMNNVAFKSRCASAGEPPIAPRSKAVV